MSLTPQQTSVDMAASLVAAMEHEDLSEDQLREIIRIEADRLGLTFADAIERARENCLPHTPAGFDLQFHIFMLIS